jgi:hypothetical protein
MASIIVIILGSIEVAAIALVAAICWCCRKGDALTEGERAKLWHRESLEPKHTDAAIDPHHLTVAR